MNGYLFATFFALIAFSGCSTLKSIFVAGNNQQRKPIANPFPGYYAAEDKGDTMVFRTKKGDGAVEVEVPRSGQNVSEFVIPISPDMQKPSRSPASEGSSASFQEPAAESALPDREPSLSDREITRNFPRGPVEDEGQRREIEEELGLLPADESPERAKSYLASIDHVKQLYRSSRYEAALLKVDDLLRQYPTNPKLYQMRGTLLERLGQNSLALSAWKQALRLDPGNQSLQRFIERREKKRSTAGQ